MAFASQKGKGLMRPTKSVGIDFDDKLLWNHVKVVSVAAAAGGNRVWMCNYCNKRFTGSYNRVKSHLLKIPNHGVQICSAIGGEILRVLKTEHEQVERKKPSIQVYARKKADYVSLPEGNDLLQPKKRKGPEGGAIEKSFGLFERNTADKLAARMFFASGLSFNFARSPYFTKYSLFLAENHIPGYIPPAYDRLRTSLLAQEKTNIARKLQPIRDTWRKKGLSICSDGWSDIKRRPLINIMASSSRAQYF
ncbi:uncharacterized protein LOC132037453 [Lycium ferocissimum]|uniref:uncharacterized protein LOC132037453 n=1 Tax=Lycium ferocissimum TaxID=112874 RepID=UPI0028155078|nr:uncharacterized protein LOC132037453 [Lycium ferocissimum]